MVDPLDKRVTDLEAQVAKFAEISRAIIKGDFTSARIQLDALDPNDEGTYHEAHFPNQ